MADENIKPTDVLGLCPEILAHIFKYLDIGDLRQVAHVCVPWWRAAYQPLLWRDVRVKLNLEQPNPILLESLKSRGIRHAWVLDELSLEGVAEYLTGLESLRCYYSLGYLSLHRAFIHKHHNLSVLSLPRCAQLVDENLLMIASNAPNLTSLDLDWCGKLTDSALKEIARLGKLTNLILNGCVLITDAGIEFLAVAELPLVRLELRCCEKLTDVALYLVGKKMSKLEYLSFAMCVKVQGSGLESFGKDHESKIEFLDLSECPVSDDELQHITCMSQLKELHLNDCNHVGDGAMRHLSYLQNLCTLDISQGCLGDDGLSYLARNGGSNIEMLTIVQSGIFSDEGCRHLSKMKKLRHLWLLSMGGFDNITDVGMAHLCRPDSNLLFLDIGGNEWVVDSSLSYVAKMERLETLHLAGGLDFTDAGLALLAEGGSKIVDLDLGYCEQVTDAGLTHLAKMTNLKKVRLTECDVTCTGVQLLTVKGIEVRGVYGDWYDDGGDFGDPDGDDYGDDYGDPNCDYGDPDCDYGDPDCDYGDPNFDYGDPDCDYGDPNCYYGDPDGGEYGDPDGGEYGDPDGDYGDPYGGDAGNPDVGDAGNPDVGDAGNPDVGDAGNPDGGDAGNPDGGDAGVPDGGCV